MKVQINDTQELSSGFLKVLRYRLQHELFAGGMSEEFSREVMDRGYAASVFLYDPAKEVVVLIEQFRIGALNTPNPWVIETVAGVVDDGLSAEDTARKEAFEECGARIDHVTKIASYYPSVGGCNEYRTLFYAEVDSSIIEGVHGVDGENEDIRVVKYGLAEFTRMLREDQFSTPDIYIAGYWILERVS